MMVEVGAAIAAVKTTVELTKRAIDIANRLGDVELKEIILELKEDLLIKREVIIELKEKVSELETKASQKENLFFEGNVYWAVKGNDKTGPYCPKCYGEKDKVVMMATTAEIYMCQVCNTAVRHTAAKPIRTNSRVRRI